VIFTSTSTQLLLFKIFLKTIITAIYVRSKAIRVLPITPNQTCRKYFQ
ncbi:hypothetical protein Tsubulata_029060, partial [Turnera subulata]